MESTVTTSKMPARQELYFGVYDMVVRLRRINAARFLLTGKIADGNLGLDVDRNPQGFGFLDFFNDLVFCTRR